MVRSQQPVAAVASMRSRHGFNGPSRPSLVTRDSNNARDSSSSSTDLTDQGADAEASCDKDVVALPACASLRMRVYQCFGL